MQIWSSTRCCESYCIAALTTATWMDNSGKARCQSDEPEDLPNVLLYCTSGVECCLTDNLVFGLHAMMNLRMWIISIIGYWIFPMTGVLCQSHTSETIDTIRVSAKSSRTNDGNSRWLTSQVNGYNSTQNIDQSLLSTGSAFIKSYGPASLSTFSVRGGTANQTPIFWEGVPISSPTLGLSDLSLLPAFLFTEMQFTRSDVSSRYGEGAISGALQLQTTATSLSRTGITLGLSRASFGNQTLGLASQIAKNKWRAETRFFYGYGQNEFSYQRIPSNDLDTVSHNRVKQLGWLHTLSYQISDDQSITLSAWYHDTNRQIPPTTTQIQSQAEQFDHGLRTVLNYKLFGDLYDLKIKTSYIYEVNDYINPLIGISASNSFHRFFTELILRYGYNVPWLQRVGINYDYIAAQSRSFDSTATRRKLEIFGSLAKSYGQAYMTLDLRQIIVDERLVRPVLTFAAKAEIHPVWSVRYQIGTTYRLPALNDIYWQPGGNNSLLPEYGWTTELALTAKWSDHLSMQISPYSKLLNNWILWSNPDGQIFWQANNISQVWSRGIDIRLSYTSSIRSVGISNNLNANLVRSTAQQPVVLPKFDKGQTLPYVPEIQLAHELMLDHQQGYMQWVNTYAGPSQGSLSRLDGYYTADLILGHHFAFQQINGTVNLAVRNIGNTQYRVIERRPMPGRNYEIKIRFEI